MVSCGPPRVAIALPEGWGEVLADLTGANGLGKGSVRYIAAGESMVAGNTGTGLGPGSGSGKQHLFVGGSRAAGGPPGSGPGPGGSRKGGGATRLALYDEVLAFLRYCGRSQVRPRVAVQLRPDAGRSGLSTGPGPGLGRL